MVAAFHARLWVAVLGNIAGTSWGACSQAQLKLYIMRVPCGVKWVAG
jgi:hypothetical protein